MSFSFLTINQTICVKLSFAFPDASLLITGILSILKPDVMATMGHSFQDDEKTIIDIDIDIVVEKEKNE